MKIIFLYLYKQKLQMKEIESITFHFIIKKERQSDRSLSIFLSTENRREFW